MKKGFTLVEVIGVVVLLAIIMLIALPTITNSISNSKNSLSEATLKLITVAADNFVEQENYTLIEGSHYCIQLATLVSEGLLISPLQDVKTGNDIDTTQYITLDVVSINDVLKREYHLVKICPAT